MTTATGYAARDRDGNINIRTVGDTVQAAKVNWLVLVAKHMVFAHNSEGEIDRAFNTLNKQFGHEIVPVHIGPAAPSSEIRERIAWLRGRLENRDWKPARRHVAADLDLMEKIADVPCTVTDGLNEDNANIVSTLTRTLMQKPETSVIVSIMKDDSVLDGDIITKVRDHTRFLVAAHYCLEGARKVINAEPPDQQCTSCLQAAQAGIDAIGLGDAVRTKAVPFKSSKGLH